MWKKSQGESIWIVKSITRHTEDNYCNPLHPITKTCLYNFDPLQTNFYIVKLGLTEVYSILSISVQKQIVGTR